MRIYTLGYSGWRIEDVEAALERLDAVLVDIRWMARSRIPTWAGGRMAQRLGVRYAAVRDLGNTNYKGTFEQIRILDFEAGLAAVRKITAGGQSVILMCACRDLDTCHRKGVAERLASALGVEVEHLNTPDPWERVQEPALF